jgi:hypothetical protein
MQADYDMWQAQRKFRGGKVRPIVKRQSSGVRT